ncbi:hypothetical protein QUG92_11370 [Curtobacterium sp. RHCKG23]|uniref:Tetratricopeptide repeat protein n=1 Tax=Curtobacterium citri TaxID=3055139 RepID=A0ABT7T9V1_9MICO|nr:hypothetical protein [Curtobacterium citri]MDM7885704.1 hypothetical protein [Curtobacterium citri]
MGRSPEQVVADARAASARGDRRAAWDSLRTHAVRDPDEPAYRLALVETYRAAGHPDQAARWGASVPEVLTDRERVLLARIARRSDGEGALRSHLALRTVPAELVALLPSARERSRRRAERIASAFDPALALVGCLAGVGLAVGVLVTMVEAFAGGRAHEAAQVTVAAGLGAVVFLGVLAIVPVLLRRRWVVAVLLAVAVTAAVVVLAHTDPTRPLPFG